MVEGLATDVRFAVRSFSRQPAFTALVVTALALGVGAAVAIFSVLWSVALRPLPWADPDSLVSFSETRPDMPGGSTTGAFMLHNVREWQERSQSFDGVAAYWNASYALTDREEPVRVEGLRVTPDLFRILGLSAARGRLFTQQEVDSGSNQLAVLSSTAFERYLGGDDETIGGTIELDGELFTLIGVLPPDTYFPDPTVEVYVPLEWQASTDPNQQREIMLPVVGRLRDGVSIEQARAEGNILLSELRQERSQQRAVRRQQSPQQSADSGADSAQGEATGGERRVVRRQQSVEMGPESEQGEAPAVERRVVRRMAAPDSAESGPEQTDRAHQTDQIEQPEHAAPEHAAMEMEMEMAEDQVRLELATLLDQQVEPVRPALRLLIGAVFLVLLIACANVANLLLTRGVQRRRELATRAALGAGRFGLGRLLFVESFVLSAVGGALGLFLAWVAVQVVRHFDPGDLPRLAEIGLEPTVVVFAIALTMLASLAFGMVPTLQTSFSRLTAGLGRDGASQGSRVLSGLSVQSLLRSGLAVIEVALALVLLIGAGLLARSFYEMAQEDPGYRAEGVLTAAVAPPPARYPAGEARNNFFRQLLAGLEAVPEVESAAAANFLPLFQGRIVLSTLIEGQAPPSDPSDAPQADLRVVTADYFQALGIELREGRAFGDSDRAGAPPVAIVNQKFADRYLEPGRAIGTRLMGFGEIVGVVSDVRAQGLDTEPAPMFYLPFEQAPPMMAEIFTRMHLVVRSADPMATVTALRKTLENIDRGIALEDVRTMEDRLSESVAQPRFYAVVLSVFAGLALILAVVGVYGVLSFAVSQETRETGIRMALGARREQVLTRTLLRGLRLTLLGVTLGLIAAFAATRLLAAGLEGMLYQLEPTDPWTFAVLALVLTATALVACWVPARRAASANPIVALRHE
jgi:predicted permease